MSPPVLPPERIWDRVAVTSSGCWEWTGSRHTKGYGKLRVNGITMGAHRVAYELAVGPIPPGHQVCHHCDNPPCINPAHLFAGTNSDNMLDASAKGRLFISHAALPAEKQARGERHGRAKLREADIPIIRARIASGDGLGLIAQDYGISKAAVSLIGSRKKWRHVA